MPKAYTVKESIEKNKKLNEAAKRIYEEYKDTNPKLAEIIKNDISLMPSDVIYVNSEDEED